MSFAIRRATAGDVESIFAFGTSDPAFAVSRRIPFYEKTELEEWVVHPLENLLLVAEIDGRLVGFLFCKVISHHWAMLDNLYVESASRRRGLGRQLVQHLAAILRSQGVEYISTLVDEHAAPVSNYVRRLGFTCGKSYVWHELFLADIES